MNDIFKIFSLLHRVVFITTVTFDQGLQIFFFSNCFRTIYGIRIGGKNQSVSSYTFLCPTCPDTASALEPKMESERSGLFHETRHHVRERPSFLILCLWPPCFTPYPFLYLDICSLSLALSSSAQHFARSWAAASLGNSQVFHSYLVTDPQGCSVASVSTKLVGGCSSFDMSQGISFGHWRDASALPFLLPFITSPCLGTAGMGGGRSGDMKENKKTLLYLVSLFCKHRDSSLVYKKVTWPRVLNGLSIFLLDGG